MADGDAARVNRAKLRAIAKRDGYVERIRAIYALSLSGTEGEVVPQIVMLVEELDEIWSAFTL